MRTQFNLRNEQIHSLLDNQLNGRPHMIHITRKKAMTEIRVLKEGAKTRHINFREIKTAFQVNLLLTWNADVTPVAEMATLK